ncbi:MAG: hypothetical protein IIU94_00505, partial [Alistipes sp.]|nr:hypothetical protein [Alistipes sp.]
FLFQRLSPHIIGQRIGCTEQLELAVLPIFVGRTHNTEDSSAPVIREKFHKVVSARNRIGR